MVSAGESGTHGWMIDAAFAVGFVIVWTAIVMIYGLYRSRGDAVQDEIRPSGPIG